VDGITKRQGLLLSPEKPFHLSIYAEQMALAFAEFGSCQPKHRKDIYALNVLDFLDVSAFEVRETSKSSSSTTESTAT